MLKYDVENLLADLKKILVANLNTAIAAVEAEKIAQGLPATGLLPIDTTLGYFEQTWSDAILNITPALFFGLEEAQAVGIGPATSEKLKFFVEVIVLDSGMDVLTKNRVHRYSRALKDVMEANYDRIPSSSKIKVETVRPIAFKLDLDSSEEYKVGGISITTSIG